ncbi:MAG: GDSL-type esterase/lipase family protein [Oscillospiraceae bacterium]|nr:GDSL-type esterase/lipase family protein [Oscillospiraceae bacterium]
MTANQTPRASAADRIRADRLRQRRREKRMLSTMTVLALVFLIAFVVCLLVTTKIISGLKDSTAQLEEENTQLTQELTEAQAVAAEAQELLDEAAARAQPAADGFFDDALFVGDSVSYRLELYAAQEREDGGECLDAAQFFTAGSLGWDNLLWDLDTPSSVHPSYQGEKMYLEDAVAASGAKKVYIMLGMNDVGAYEIDEVIEAVNENCTRVLAENPDVEIFIESVTPILASKETTSLNNEVVDNFNQALENYCSEQGFAYLDVASVMKNESGSLISEYCSDPDAMGIHFSAEGCAAWIEYLEQHPYGV